VQHYLGHAPVARYAVASNVGGIPTIVLEMLATTWMPRIFAARNDGALVRSLALSRDALLVLLVPTVAGLSLCSPLLLGAWAPASFRPNGLLLIVALTATAAFPFAEASSHQRILMRCGRTRAVALAAAGAAVCNLVLNVLLIPLIGVTAPGVATLASFVFMDLLLGRASRHQLAIAPSSWRLLVDVALCFAVSYGVVLLPVSTPFLIARGLLAAGCSLVAIAALTRLSRPRRLTAGPISAWLGSRLGTVEL
jgi:O-antigen/teichoic acid export membrane protein